MQIPNRFESHLQSFTEAMKVRGYSPRTIESYRVSVRIFLAYLDQANIDDLRAVNGVTLREYQRWLQQQDYAGWTVLARLQAVRRLFDHLEATQVLLLNPCPDREPLKVAYRLPKMVLTEEEAQCLLNTPNSTTAIGLRDKVILEVFYSSGIRLEEMTVLTVADVDYVNGFLRVNHGKGARDRVVPLGKNACQWVRQYVEQVRSGWSPPQRNESALWLSSRSPHLPLKSQAIAVMVRRYGRLAGVPKPITPHLWRHTCATHLVARGANVAYVQRLLGHSSLRTTQVYVRTSVPEVQATHAQAHPRNQSTAL
jgi:integrase/recombinase XerD